VTNFEQVRRSLSKLQEDGNSFAILEDGDRFIQTAIDGSTLILEKNEGSKEQHYRATHNGSEKFSREEVEAIFRSYFEGERVPSGVQWSKIEVRGSSRPLWWLLWALPWAGGAFLLYQFARSSHDLWKWIH
jgi:hypothetical protein